MIDTTAAVDNPIASTTPTDHPCSSTRTAIQLSMTILLGKKGSGDVFDVLNCGRSFVSLIWRCLQMDPGSRMTPNQALHHRFMTQDFSSQE